MHRKTSSVIELSDSGYESSTQSKKIGEITMVGGGRKEALNIDYIKNVFIKYLEYLANANDKEATTLEKVLFTVLKATEKDIELIEKARQKNNGGFLSYFYSTGA